MTFYKVPFRGGTKRAQLVNHSVYDTDFQQVPRNDILRNDNKVFATAPHPSLRDTFSPREKALMAVPLKTNGLVVMLGFFTKDFYAVPFRGIATSLRFLAMTFSDKKRL